MCDPQKCDSSYGAKGIGEIGNIPTTPAITNAIFNVVAVQTRDLPVDQDRLARTIKGELKGYSVPSS